MDKIKAIKEHMEVVGSDGGHESRIKLTKSDPASGGQHHFIAAQWVASVDNKVHLNKSAKDATAQWQAAA